MASYKLLPRTMTHNGYISHTPSLCSPSHNALLKYLMDKVFVHDFITIPIPSSQQQLDHLASSTMYDILNIFPPNVTALTDIPISDKKLTKGEGVWANVKDIFVMTFDGKYKTILHSADKWDNLIDTLRSWISIGNWKG